ncbi:MAG: hypothetical protein AMJ59_06020 [Gammaproteobacteria bacterium SG8_31]|jgi:hypothetical protein|nr:MAG: hypothetical protein AMJ59_06020 [Gammaproteobacteria bacterium SG8_31]
MIYVWRLEHAERRHSRGRFMQVADHDEKKKINAEWRFLARRVLMICETIDSAAVEAAASDSLSREAALQSAAFRERRERALSLMAKIRQGNDSPTRHLEDLRRLVSGLECSRSFFDSRRKIA